MTLVSKPQREILHIRNLPDLQQVEDRLRLYESGRNLSAESEDLLDRFCRANFGIGLREFDFQWPDNFGDLPFYKKWEIEDSAAELDAMFEATGASPEQAVAIFLKYKIDFSDEFGRPLLCTEHLMKPVEIAAIGVKGKIPNPMEVNIGNWEAKMQDQAAKIKSKKKRA